MALLELLKALAGVGSWRDTLSDEDALPMLREFNTIGGVLHRPQ